MRSKRVRVWRKSVNGFVHVFRLTPDERGGLAFTDTPLCTFSDSHYPPKSHTCATCERRRPRGMQTGVIVHPKNRNAHRKQMITGELISL